MNAESWKSWKTCHTCIHRSRCLRRPEQNFQCYESESGRDRNPVLLLWNERNERIETRKAQE